MVNDLDSDWIGSSSNVIMSRYPLSDLDVKQINLEIDQRKSQGEL